MIRKAYCSWHGCECDVLKEASFNKKSMDVRMKVICEGSEHEPTPGVIFGSKEEYLVFMKFFHENKVKEYNNDLKKIREE